MRRILNFGHTYAHAVEKITNYKKYTHGEAVAFGMVFAINLAAKRGLIKEDYKNESLELINSYNLFKKMPTFDIKKIAQLMKSDKKVEDGKIKFILPSSKSFVECYDITFDEIIS